MHFTWKDLAATVAVGATVVPFVGFMSTGSMPFVQDPTGMAAVALVLGLIAAAVGGWFDERSALAQFAAFVVGLGGLAVGLLVLVSENFLDVSTRDGLLIAGMAAMVVLWAVAIIRHGGLVIANASTPRGAAHP